MRTSCNCSAGFDAYLSDPNPKPAVFRRGRTSKTKLYTPRIPEPKEAEKPKKLKPVKKPKVKKPPLKRESPVEPPQANNEPPQPKKPKKPKFSLPQLNF